MLGLAAANELGRRGRDVVCLEQDEVGEVRSCSKGESRLLRLSHADPFYVRLAAQAKLGWEQLEAESGRQLLVPVGVVIVGDGAGDFFSASSAGGVTVEWLAARELRDRFPEFHFDCGGLYEEGACVVLARDVLDLFTESRSVELHEHTRVTRIRETDNGVTIEAQNRSYDCKVAIVCVGAWSGDLARQIGLIGWNRLTPSVVPVMYLRPRSGSLEGVPAFIELGGHRSWGVPTPTRGTYKVGLDIIGDVVDPATVSLILNDAERRKLADASAGLLHGFEERPLASERCMYANGPHDDFVIDRVGRIVMGAGTSAHGFKFGPVLGGLLADLAEGKEPSVSAERFSFERLVT